MRISDLTRAVALRLRDGVCCSSLMILYIFYERLCCGRAAVLDSLTTVVYRAFGSFNMISWISSACRIVRAGTETTYQATVGTRSLCGLQPISKTTTFNKSCGDASI